MVCLGPRDPGESVGPRPLSGVVVRPLNFTVRRKCFCYGGKVTLNKNTSGAILLGVCLAFIIAFLLL